MVQNQSSEVVNSQYIDLVYSEETYTNKWAGTKVIYSLITKHEKHLNMMKIITHKNVKG